MNGNERKSESEGREMNWRRSCVLLFFACLFWLHAPTASAQSTNDPLLGRVELAAGVSWIGAASFGASDASLTGVSGDRYRLFSTSTELAGAPGFDARLGRRVTRIVQAEITASYSPPALTTSIGNDAENAAPIVVSESIRQLTIVGSVVVYLPGRRVGSRVLPFVTGGGGYLRQLHEGNTLAQTGGTYHAGAGAMILMRSNARQPGVKQFGLRADIRALIRTGGVALDGGAHTSPVAAISLFARF
jgi:hypothetical protein